MIAAGAFENNPESLGFPEQRGQGQRPLLNELLELGLVCQTGREDVRWRLTEAGFKRLTSCLPLSEPTRVFEPRELDKLEDLTSYGLLVSMHRNGWEWRPWAPPSKRTRRMALPGHTFDDYWLGDSKLWYSVDLAAGPKVCGDGSARHSPWA